MQVAVSRGPPRSADAFTLIEVVISISILSLLIATSFAAIVFNRLTSMKAKEEAIAMDFLIHYAENIKGLPFSQVTAGTAINPLVDGSGGAPNIRLPLNNSWIPLATTDYETFHPDLLWVHKRNPKLQVTLTPQTVNGVPHDVHLNVAMAWDAPLMRGRRLQVQLDLLRTKDL